jgi:sporulation protein YlmC with PRC-barrel domain
MKPRGFFRLVLLLEANTQIQEIEMRALLLASAAVLVLSPAIAQTAKNSQNENAGQTAPAANMRANLRNMLEKSGYKDIRVAPSSFVVRAKDTDGNPVIMSVSPDSFTEVTNLNDSPASTTGSASNDNGSTSNTFVSVPNNDQLSSKVVGLDIYNNSNQDIGQIKDIALNQNGRSQAYIVSVGGFLGMGEHYVAVNPADVKVSYNNSDKKWHASMNASADQLKAAPEFKYSGHWEASHT